MVENRDKFEDIIDDLKFVLNQGGYILVGIKTDPPLGKAAGNLLRDKGVDTN